jgi:hypothetical protein
MSVKTIVARALEQGAGILRLAPNWVPRSFCVPGHRIKLHPDDYYAMGGERGGIDERWFASTTLADNGPLTLPNAGLSCVVFDNESRTERTLSREAIQHFGDGAVGDRVWDNRQRWPIDSEFLDVSGSITRTTRWERLKHWLFPHLREGKQLAEAYTRARVAREEGEARKIAEEAIRIAVKADLEKQEDLKEFGAAVDEIFRNRALGHEARVLKLAKLIENNPEILGHVDKAQLLLRSLAPLRQSELASGRST